MNHITRRTMLKMAGAAASIGLPQKILAILDDGTIVVQDHVVPAEKNLTAEWKQALTERGQKEVWTGADLDTIGMPIGGIAAGQLYLCGDGTLGCWEIFNRHTFQDQGPYSYAKRDIPHQVAFGFSVAIGGKTYRLDKTGFKDIAFKGEHPVATVTYKDESCPATITLTAYSPFIPLNARDSAIPSTVFEFEVELPGEPQAVTFIAELENACGKSRHDRLLHTVSSNENGVSLLMHSVDPAAEAFDQEREAPRPDIPLADFEGDTYGDWKVEGEAFGTGPAKGALANQNPVSGFLGKGLANTYFKGDQTIGRLTSPPFTIERDFITFKIGGGDQPDKECINLIVDGKTVRTATGRNTEHLLWECWNVKDLVSRSAHIEIVDEATGGWGHINVDQIAQSDKVPPREDFLARHGDPNFDTGTMAIAYLGQGVATTVPTKRKDHEANLGTITTIDIPAKDNEKPKAAFVLAWHFPNHPRGRNYANRFKDAGDVCKYVSKNYQRLSHETKLWRDTYYDSTLPFWLLDRLHMTVGNLCTGTTEWWKSGRFWSWEGVVCCSGTCTHVWNYEHSMARLFPEIERNIRDRQDFGVAFDEKTGLVGFRSDREYAADGQCGTILKAYREHLTSPNDRFLKKHWSRIKKALQFLIEHDADGDGIIEDAQPNTYDIDFYGPNTFVGSLYLAALRAGEEMATEVGDQAFGKSCRNIFQSGSEATMRRLWNGEYFIQEVDQSRYKQYQYGPGCLSDQLFGQGWAHQLGLGRIYPQAETVKALQSIWKYNWAPDVAGQNKRWPPQRPFALPGEAGLFTCTWPNGGREKDPVLYRDEVWTGIEYQVAGHMIWEGLVEEGLSICRAVHERYHPSKRNPYNEVECSDHYARAMASWGVYTALSGFSYHGPAGRIAFAPRVNTGSFRAAFTAAEGWGTFEQSISSKTSAYKITVNWGRLRLSEIRLAPSSSPSLSLRLNGHQLAGSVSLKGDAVLIRLAKPAVLRAGDTIAVTSL